MGQWTLWSVTIWHHWALKVLTAINPWPQKAEKLASPTVTNSHKAEIPACRSLIYSRKDEISAWKFRGIKLLQIMLCLGAPGLGTLSSGLRGLNNTDRYSTNNSAVTITSCRESMAGWSLPAACCSCCCSCISCCCTTCCRCCALPWWCWWQHWCSIVATDDFTPPPAPTELPVIGDWLDTGDVQCAASFTYVAIWAVWF